jgi:hypothetical protein
MFFWLSPQLSKLEPCSKLAATQIMFVLCSKFQRYEQMFFWLFSLALSIWALFKTLMERLMSVFSAQNTKTGDECFSASSLRLCQSGHCSKLAAAQIMAVFSAQKYEKILTCSSASFYPGFVQNSHLTN